MIECKRKLMLGAHEQYKKATATKLWEVYSSYSASKAKAFDYCLDLAYKLFAYRYGHVKILGWNSQTFSVGFYGKLEEELVFVYITKGNDRYIKLSDLMALEEKYGGCDD